MLKWGLRLVGGLVLVLGLLFWWLFLSSSNATTSSPDVFDIADWRSKAAAPVNELPIEIRILEVGRDTAPPFAAQAGRFGAPIWMSYNAVEIVYPDRTVIVGGAIDRQIAESMTQSPTDWHFSDTAYEQLLAAMLDADHVLMTHEHLDHIIAIARHPDPVALAPKLRLNAPQISALPQFAIGSLDPALATLEPDLSGVVETLAPGLVIVPSAGHTPGSQNVFIRLQNGQEVLLIGDIVWTMQAIEDLKTRPVLTQYVVFRPNYEDRAAVKVQVGALHDMMAVEPDLLVLAAHDRDWLQQAADKDGISFLPAN